MKGIFFKLFVVFATLGSLGACHQGQEVGSKPKASQIFIDATLPASDTLDAFIEPYRRRLNQVLDSPLCYAPRDITKTEGRLNTPLGNLMADLMLERASAVFEIRENIKVDLALLNFGGMRSAISRGPVSERTAYEVMPFENNLVVVGMRGHGLRKLVEFLMGAPRPHAFSGMEIVLEGDGRLRSVTVSGRPIEDERVYYIATSDYLVGGGDNMTFFEEGESLFNTDYKIRNAMVDYFGATDTLRTKTDHRFIQLDSL
jgi:2',3'-cyclic-nucleotide 2'-phosphodiesterase (5'-nucleotidase family)